ncbi:MAG: DNA polymerase III subunit delta' [Lachnospiraceae bacterium]|nr:DNA polymerase III subunit delta' [Lachnospiraceae bacterium]MCI9547117.1 DNA polymerase III subunit delta' [Lachnospiraceae bacterium]
MKDFDSIVGHEQIIEHMKNSISQDKVSHAYVLVGERGAGKKTLAGIYAMALQCEQGGSIPCKTCDSCKKANSKNHPDIIYVEHEKGGSIGVEEIRSQVVDDVAIRPYNGRYKIYIISDADMMTPQAQNAILKTIEEPPAYAVFLLLAVNADALLPTIQSRCVRLDVRPVSDELVKKYLVEHMHVPDYEADLGAAFAQGNIGKAKQAADASYFDDMARKAIYILKYAATMEIHEWVEAMGNLSKDKEMIYNYLDIFQVWFRDVLMFKATREVDYLVFKREINSIKQQASQHSYEGIENIIHAADKAKIRLQANVNFDLAMELLFLTIREK